MAAFYEQEDKESYLSLKKEVVNYSIVKQTASPAYVCLFTFVAVPPDQAEAAQDPE